MKINTGRGTIPLITLVGIWSVSALTSLPGLAVSPILGQLTTIFPYATELDIQMLTSLPSLLIIPFVLLAGKLAEKRDFVRLLKVGLWMFAASGVLYLFSDKMWQLMVKDETFAQTQPRLNLATFVTTYMDEYATKLIGDFRGSRSVGNLFYG